MSYDIDLVYEKANGEKLLAKGMPHTEGGTIAIGGDNCASMNVTYNYGFFYYHFLDKDLGIRWLYGKKAKDTVERLEAAIKILGTKKYEKDYWAPTPGNAGHALNVLLGWAKQHPEAIWQGD